MFTQQLFEIFVQICPKKEDDFDYFNIKLRLPFIPTVGDYICLIGISNNDENYLCDDLIMKMEDWKHLNEKKLIIKRRQIDLHPDRNSTIWFDAETD